MLVVDDEPSILRAVRTNLGRHDFRVETATTGGEALEAYARVHPDVVLLDLGLPDYGRSGRYPYDSTALEHAYRRAVCASSGA